MVSKKFVAVGRKKQWVEGERIYDNLVFEPSGLDLYAQLNYMMHYDYFLLAYSVMKEEIIIGGVYNNIEYTRDPEYIANGINHEVMHGMMWDIMMSDGIDEHEITKYQDSHWPYLRGLDDIWYINTRAPVLADDPNGFKFCPVIYDG